MKSAMAVLALFLISGISYSQTDTSSTLQGGGVDQNIIDSLGLVNPQVQKFYNKGVQSMKSKDYMSAVQNFTEALLIDPSYIDALYNRGIAFKELGKNEDADEFEAFIANFDS